jgi:hypothetical protein
MVDPYFEILLKQWEDSEDDNNYDGESGDSMDQWQAYVPDHE